MANDTAIPVSTSLFVKRWRKFKSMKRGYWSLIIFTST
jgi:ABC-type microcin C transport system permease subunit YejE